MHHYSNENIDHVYAPAFSSALLALTGKCVLNLTATGTAGGGNIIVVCSVASAPVFLGGNGGGCCASDDDVNISEDKSGSDAAGKGCGGRGDRDDDVGGGNGGAEVDDVSGSKI